MSEPELKFTSSRYSSYPFWQEDQVTYKYNYRLCFAFASTWVSRILNTEMLHTKLYDIPTNWIIVSVSD